MSVATDHALATIASILDQPGPPPVADEPPAMASDKAIDKVIDKAPDRPAPKVIVTVKPAPAAPEPARADGYSKYGPGPMNGIRFRWTVRRAEEGFYVDETVGPGLAPVAQGPMSAEAAIKYVDERAAAAHERFEALKNEMTGQGPPVPIIIAGAGEK